MIRPSFRLPLWAAVALPAAAYVGRSLVRGSFAPDLPGDALVYALLALVIAAVAIGRTRAARYDDDQLAEKVQHGDRSPDDRG